MGNVTSSEKRARKALSAMSQHELDQALADVVERNELPIVFDKRYMFNNSTTPQHDGFVNDAKGYVMRALLNTVDIEEDPDQQIFYFVKGGDAKVLSIVLTFNCVHFKG